MNWECMWLQFFVNMCRRFVIFSEVTLLNVFEKMDLIWMTKLRTSLEYQRGVDEFLERVTQNAGVGNRIYCLCLRCGNKSLHYVIDAKGHLYFNGNNSSYQKWIWHGEGATSSASMNFTRANVGVEFDENENDDDVIGMLMTLKKISWIIIRSLKDCREMQRNPYTSVVQSSLPSYPL